MTISGSLTVGIPRADWHFRAYRSDRPLGEVAFTVDAGPIRATCRVESQRLSWFRDAA